MTRWLWVSILLTGAACGLSWYVSSYRHEDLPERIPVHWDINGQPNDWVARDDAGWAFWMMPATMAALVVLTIILPWISPRPFDVERFRSTYGYMMTLAVALMGYLHVMIVLGMLQRLGGADIGRWLLAGVFLFVAAIGNVLGRLRRNFWMGIRTPWTLASEAVWIQTHRLAAWLWVAGGLVGFVALLAGVPVLWAIVALLVVMVAGPILASLVIYQRLERAGKA
jgi:uncharacterized membrane protein